MYYRALALNSLHRYFEAMKQCDKALVRFLILPVVNRRLLDTCP